MAEVVAKYKLDVNDAVKNLDKLQKETKSLDNDLDKAGKDGTKSLDNVGKKASGLSSTFNKLGGVIAAAFAVDRVISIGKEMVNVAAKAEGIERAFQKLNRPNLLANLRKATRGTVSDLELMQKAVRANNFQIPLDKLATFFEFATKRSIETGESVDYLVNSIVDGIGRKSTLVLDNLGISASQLQEEIKRTGDFGVAAANIIEQSLAETGEVADTTAIKIAQLNTAMENLKVQGGNAIITAFDELSKSWEGASNQLKELLGTQEDLNIFGKILKHILDDLKAPFEALGAVSEWTLGIFNNIKNGINEIYDSAKKELADAGIIYQVQEQSEKTERSVKGLSGAIASFYALLKKGETEEYVRSIAQLNTELKDLQSAFELAEIGGADFYKIADQIEAKIEEINLAMRLLVERQFATQPDIEIGIKTVSEIDQQKAETDDILADYAYRNGEIKKAVRERNEMEAALAEERKQQEQQIALAITEQSLNTISQVIGSIAQIQQNAFAAEQEELNRQLEQGLITREEFERKDLEIRKKAAQTAKDTALFQAILSTAQATVAALGAVPFTPANIAFAALVGATGAAQIAAIASQPLPQFAEGGLVAEHGMLQGKTHAQGGILVEAERDEFFVNAKRTRENIGLLKAVNDGTVESFIMSKYVNPMIDESLFKGFGDIGNSAKLNGITANLKDHNILHGLDRLRQSQTYGLNMVAGKLDKLSNRNTRTGW
jgi:hypothetical protein